MDQMLKPGETLEDLQRDGLMLIQKERGFRFGLDAVLLSDFAKIRQKERVLDLGTGSGILPILLQAKSDAEKIVGVEIQRDFVEMAQRSVKLNRVEGKVEIIEADIRSLTMLKKASFDVVVTNPPYTRANSGVRCQDESKDIACNEILCQLEDVLSAARDALCVKGRFYMVHRAERLVDVMALMRMYAIEPRTLQFVHAKKNKKPHIFLVHGVKQGGKDLTILAPLILHEADGSWTSDVQQIYRREHSK